MIPFTLFRRLLQAIVLLLFTVQHTLIFYGVPIVIGSLLSSRVLGVIDFVDLTAAIEKVLAYKQLIVFPTIAFLTTFILYLILGRAFCGWVCPLDILYSFGKSLQESRSQEKSVNPQTSSGKCSSLKIYSLILIIFFISSIPLYIPVYTNYLNIITVFSTIINSIGGAFSLGMVPPTKIEYALTLLVISFSLDLVLTRACPRFWCRRICITGLTYGLLNKLSLLTIKISKKLCIFCGKCDKTCRTSIPIISKYIEAGKQYIRDIDCIKCLECVEVCPTKALTISFSIQRHS